MKEILTMSEGGKSEYCCNIIKVPEIIPIEGSDFLGYAMINGLTVVVRKDQVREGEILFYVANECRICGDFLSVNNLYSSSCYELNANCKEVEKILKEGGDIKAYCGFFEKNGRVRAIKLKGVKSYGFIFSRATMMAYCPDIKGLNLEDYIGKDFDTVAGRLFVEAYIPKTNKKGGGAAKPQQKKSNDIDCIIPNEFLLHYDTDPIGKNMFKFKPDSVVTISVKLHGTSLCYGNVLSKIPIRLPIVKRLLNFFIKVTGLFKSKKTDNFKIGYQDIYSSRSVIKNKYANVKSPTFYSEDVWGAYHRLLEGRIPQGMTIYGEIIGFTENLSYIQDGYDYNCLNTNKLMIYRISIKDEATGNRREFNVEEVYNWTLKFMAENPDIQEHIHPIDILYHGTLKDLYPQLDTASEHWGDEVLECLKKDKQRLGMELAEPLCTHKVPREGVVIRIDDDPLCEAFKLKCDKFMDKEREAIDKGIVDTEMTA